MGATTIGWTDETWNPVTGCTKVSAGCKHCYAERITERWGRDFAKIELHESRLRQPLTWKKPRMVFVNSMSDQFHESVPFEFIDKCFAAMACSRRHRYQILTKRPARMAEYLCRKGVAENIAWTTNFVIKQESHYGESVPWPLPNVWLGTSVENQAAADERIPHLLRCPAAVRFLSVEPLLGPVNLGDCEAWHTEDTGALPPGSDPRLDIDWVIIGGESGPGHRPMQIDWLRSIVDQCKAAGVPVFVKQDSGPRPGQQGRIPDDIWALKEFPKPTRPNSG